ncbi:MAG: hypothetical protein N2Z85_01255 [Patescibacteria group bacterium]|nr:hypothetical protein [Patescibacteria group bacterium]
MKNKIKSKIKTNIKNKKNIKKKIVKSKKLNSIKNNKKNLKSNKSKKIIKSKLIKNQKAKIKKKKNKSILKKSKKNTKIKKSQIILIKRPDDLLIKHEKPIIYPSHNEWECWQTFNPGVILLDNKIHFIYRAIGSDGISRLGYANSLDGFFINERLLYPVYEHKIKTNFKFNYYSFLSGGSFGGAEDPRLVKIEGEDKIYMTYTACDNGLRVALTSINVDDFLNKNWKWEKPALISSPNEVHKNWVIFPEKINGHYAILHSLSPEILIDYRKSLDFDEDEYILSYYNCYFRNKNSWDYWIRGVGAPPLKTKLGWLVFYHAMQNGEFNKYKVGAMILDYNNPTKIVLKSPYPIIEPDQEYENNGFKAGVVYVTGAIIKDSNIYIYYGAADSYIGVAYGNLDEFLDYLQKDGRTILRLKHIKIKK